MNGSVQQSQAALGKAVHLAAVARLHELWPEASIGVEHFIEDHWRITRVTIRRDDSASGYVRGESICHPDDRYERKFGIEQAFRRALDMVRKNERDKRWIEAQRRNAREVRK